MKITNAVELMGLYQACLECGNTMVGNGEGTISIEGDVFKRTCKCGWGVEVHPVPKATDPTESPSVAAAETGIGGSYE